KGAGPSHRPPTEDEWVVSADSAEISSSNLSALREVANCAATGGAGSSALKRSDWGDRRGAWAGEEHGKAKPPLSWKEWAWVDVAHSQQLRRFQILRPAGRRTARCQVLRPASQN